MYWCCCVTLQHRYSNVLVLLCYTTTQIQQCIGVAVLHFNTDTVSRWCVGVARLDSDSVWVTMSEYHHQPGPAFTHPPPHLAVWYKYTVGDHTILRHSAWVLLLVVPPIEFPVHQLYPSFDLFLHLICVQTKKWTFISKMILVTLSFYPRHEIILSSPVLINLFMPKTCQIKTFIILMADGCSDG